ncbi:MAG TPA: DNA gyrase subunit A, partial [Firmicutes bacterium]|nr:DNA gyrase subunit A [Bacillota bacterium]
GIESENNAENAKGVFDEAADVLLATSGGLLIRFPVSQLRTLGRTARGVKGITLLEDEKVIGMSVVTGDNAVLLFVTENGFGKRTRLSEFRSQNRGGRGVLAFKPSKRSGAMVSFMPVQKKEELIAITARGLIIRAKVSQIPIQKRYAGGVTLMRLTPEDKVVNVAVVARE